MKRVFDVLVAGGALVLLSPVILAVWVLVGLSMGAPVFFHQERAGQNGKTFRVSKFRTMREAYDAVGAPLPDADRATLTGGWLRRARLDELPQLWAILVGDMSFVGPRPLPHGTGGQSSLATERQKVRPGLTGLAQVSGNTLLNNAEKFAIDALYVRDASFAKDCQILLKTAKTILQGERRDEQLIREAMSYAQRLDRGS